MTHDAAVSPPYKPGSTPPPTTPTDATSSRATHTATRAARGRTTDGTRKASLGVRTRLAATRDDARDGRTSASSRVATGRDPRAGTRANRQRPLAPARASGRDPLRGSGSPTRPTDQRRRRRRTGEGEVWRRGRRVVNETGGAEALGEKIYYKAAWRARRRGNRRSTTARRGWTVS